MAGTLIEDIMAYGDAAKRGEVACSEGACPRCGGMPEKYWRNGVRKRLFLVFVEVVCRVWSYLSRWRCPLCKRSFTDYPDFALPFKRYPAQFVLARSVAYASDRTGTYREGVRQEDGMPVSHADAEGGMELSPSTLWRWMETLAAFANAERQLLALIKQQDPSASLFRALAAVRIRAGKYRSEARKALLARCCRISLIAQVHRQLFGVSIFPEFGTRSGFP